MKKALSIFLMVAVILSMSITAFAAPGDFVSSPSGNQAPVLVNYRNESPDCESELAVTAYADRDKLSKTARDNLNAAYNSIVGASDLSALNSKIADIASQLGVNVQNLAVSDLFDISRTDCEFHEDHGRFIVTLKPETLKNFVCLLQYIDGKWTVVEKAEVIDSDKLEFYVDEVSAFAIVVNTGAVNAVSSSDTVVNTSTDSPQTGGRDMLWVYAVIMFAAACGAFVAFKISKKEKL